MIKKLKSVKFFLFLGLILSILISSYAAYYKIYHWGFNLKPKQVTNTWNIEAHINFKPTGTPIKINIATPKENEIYKILDETIIAPNYVTKKEKESFSISSKGKFKEQNIYYRSLLFEDKTTEHKTDLKAPKVVAPNYNTQEINLAKSIIETAKMNNNNKFDLPQNIIATLNQDPTPSNVSSFIPFKISNYEKAQKIIDLLALEKIPAKYVKGVYLVESKVTFSPEHMIKAFIDNKWNLYNINSAEISSTKKFIVLSDNKAPVFQIEGGEEASVKYSILKSSTSNLSLVDQRAKLSDSQTWFDISAFSLPIKEQNTIKWLSAFPLAILIIVVLRNIVGLSTMGTFTPMLIAMSLTQTGFTTGILAFVILLTLGMIIRSLLSKCNLLLVPRISSVVIFVIIIMHFMTIVGYKLNVEIAIATVSFPIIIIAWIIERASITWEEEGSKSAIKEIIFSLITATLTYFVINNEIIKHITFIFYEINLVILFLVMLIGTYTGYRLSELKRFTPLVRGK